MTLGRIVPSGSDGAGGDRPGRAVQCPDGLRPCSSTPRGSGPGGRVHALRAPRRAARRWSSARAIRTPSSPSSARRRGSTRIARARRSRGARGELLGAPARRGRPVARRGLPRDRAQVQAAGEPRPVAGGVGRVRAVPLPPARARPATSRGDARQLRDRAALRPRARDHARPRAGAGGDARRAPRDAVPALPPRRRALHADDARRARAGRRAPARAARRPRRGSVCRLDTSSPARLGGRARLSRGPRPASGSRCSSGSSEWRRSRSRAARRRRPRRSPRGSPGLSLRATSSSSRASSARARPRSSAAPAARSASRAASRARRSRSATATAGRSTSRTSTSTAFGGSPRRSGAISSRTSRTPSCSSSGPRPERAPCRSRGRTFGSSTWRRPCGASLVETADRALLEESTGAGPGLRHGD